MRAFVCIFILALLSGCQAQSHPWQGTAYQPPSNYKAPPQSIYAPMPSILPSVERSEIDGIAPDDGLDWVEELELNEPHSIDASSL